MFTYEVNFLLKLDLIFFPSHFIFFFLLILEFASQALLHSKNIVFHQNLGKHLPSSFIIQLFGNTLFDGYCAMIRF